VRYRDSDHQPGQSVGRSGTLRDNRNNWTFRFRQPAEPSTWNLKLHDIAFAKGNIAYADEVTKANMQAVIDTLGQPVPIGDVLKQQEEASRKSSAQMIGKKAARAS